MGLSCAIQNQKGKDLRCMDVWMLNEGRWSQILRDILWYAEKSKLWFVAVRPHRASLNQGNGIITSLKLCNIGFEGDICEEIEFGSCF